MDVPLSETQGVVFPKGISAVQTQGGRCRWQELVWYGSMRCQQAAAGHQHRVVGNDIPQCAILLHTYARENMWQPLQSA
jgi:hypothetical protein